MSAQAGPSAYALLTDGTTIEIRPARPDDFRAVREMYAQMSPENLYLRFFSMSRAAAEQEARRVCREPSPHHAALLAVLHGRVVGCGAYEIARDGSRSAEVAHTVADDMHNRGVGTLLMEHLVSLADSRGVRTLIAETLTENTLMLQVFANAGLRAHRTLQDGVYNLRFPLPGHEGEADFDTYREAVAERERSAGVASLRHVLIPASVAVIGVSHSRGSAGRAILANIIAGGFSGPVYAVGSGPAELDGALRVPSPTELDGALCVPSPAELPGQVDLAVIAVPTSAVLGVAEDCGRQGVKALAVITSGLDRAARAELLGICRRHGMRLVGPTSFGVANTAISLDATLAAQRPRPGIVGLAAESTGGAGFVLVEHLSRLGLGISSLVSLGDKADVSGTDMLRWWESDPATKLAVLYLESFGNPRKFVHAARHAGRSMPILTVNAGRSSPGRRRAAIRAAAELTPQLTRQALFGQAGVIATANLGELLDTAVLLASQPLPAGGRVGVVSNTRGGDVLAADACGDAGLEVARLSGQTQEALRNLLPPGAAVAGPVDTTAMAAPGLFRQCLELVGADPGVDVVLALTVTTAAGDAVPEMAAARLPVPIAAAVMDQVEAVRMLTGPGGGLPVPAYAYPESAARALGYAARYGTWRAASPATSLEPEDLCEDRARQLVTDFLAGTPRGGWLPRQQTEELLGCYGVTLVDSVAVTTEEDAVTAAARFGGPVALKADVPGLVVRRKNRGAVLLELHGADEIRRAYGSLTTTFAGRLSGIIVQPMITGGVEVKISVLEEQVFGPLVLFGLADATADVLADRAARLAPLTSSDADELIRSVRASPLLLGRSGKPRADLASLKDMLLRVSRLADGLPQVAELDLSPVIARRDGTVPVDARIRIQSARPSDTYLRQLP